MSVAGKLAFVTGAGSGIGRAACKVLSREGANVIAADTNLMSAQETIAQISTSSHHTSLLLDVAQSASVRDSLKKVLEIYKNPPTIIVNCAGIRRDHFLLKMSEEDFQEVINVNLKGTFLIMQTFANAIVDKQLTNASFINISSIFGKFPNMGQVNYCASKAGVDLMTKVAAKELGQFGIRCNTILPGFIETPMTAAIPDKIKAKFLPIVPLRRLGKPEEIGEVITFLASDKSSYINGASIEVSAGF